MTIGALVVAALILASAIGGLIVVRQEITRERRDARWLGRHR